MELRLLEWIWRMRLRVLGASKAQNPRDERQEEFNEKVNRFFDEHGLLDFDKVKLDGIKPRKAHQELTAGSDQTMEV
jgi:hypothetical protein